MSTIFIPQTYLWAQERVCDDSGWGVCYCLGFDLLDCHKFKDEQDMATKVLSERKLRQIEEIAAGWGKLLARESFPGGPGLDVSLADMEDIVARATNSIVSGAVETMTADQAGQLGEQAACPGCGKMCKLKRKTRSMAVRGGNASLAEPVGHCPTCRRDFFPSA